MAFWIDVLVAVLGFVQVNSTELYAVRQSELQMGIEQKGGGKRCRFLPIISSYVSLTSYVIWLYVWS